MDSAIVVLEEVMRAAIENGRQAAALASQGDLHAAGQVFAYHDMLDVLREQADLMGLRLSESSLSEFDPDELLRLSVPAKRAA